LGAGLVDAAVRLGEVVAPGGVEVAVAPAGAQLEDGFGALQAQPAPVMSSRSPTRCGRPLSITPVAIGQPRSSAAW
jgi:hypothetical protein